MQLAFSFWPSDFRRAAPRFSRRARVATVAGLVGVVGLATIGTAGSAALFVDGFESGSFSQWSTVHSAAGGMATVQRADAAVGSYAARLSATSTTGSVAYARRHLSVPLADLTVSGRFKILAQGPAGTDVPFLRLFDGSGRRLVSVHRQSETDDGLWVQYGGAYLRSSGGIPLGAWSELEVGVSGAGTQSGSVEIRINDLAVYEAAGVALDGPVAILQIGNDVEAQPFDVEVDDVSVTDTTLSSLPPSTVPPTASTSSTTTTVTSPPVTEPVAAGSTTTTATTSPAKRPSTTSTTRRAVTTSTLTAPPPITTTTPTTALPPPPGSFYVDSVHGNDSLAGTAPSSAWKTLARATKTPFEPGDRLHLARGGSWTTRLAVTRNGTAARPITITAYGSGNRPLLTGGSNGDCVSVAGSHVVISGLEVLNCGWAGIGVSGDSNRVEDNVVRGNVAGVFVAAGGVGNQILRNDIRDNNRMSVLTRRAGDDSGAFGILLWGDDTEVAYNTITGSEAFSYDYGRDGAAVEIYGGQRNHIHHNKAYANDAFSELGHARTSDNTFAYNLVRNGLDRSTFLVTRGGGSFGPVLRTRLLNNTVHLTGANAQGVVCGGGCDATILSMRGNVIQASHKVGWADQTFDSDFNVFWGGEVQFKMGAHDVVADPRFVDPGRGDLRPGAGSPAIDRVPATQYGADLDGRLVPQNGDGVGSALPDAGAYERSP